MLCRRGIAPPEDGGSSFGWSCALTFAERQRLRQHKEFLSNHVGTEAVCDISQNACFTGRLHSTMPTLKRNSK
eukprot:11108459-Lingulodinium_polyedra.AAC.1